MLLVIQDHTLSDGGEGEWSTEGYDTHRSLKLNGKVRSSFHGGARRGVSNRDGLRKCGACKGCDTEKLREGCEHDS